MLKKYLLFATVIICVMACIISGTMYYRHLFHNYAYKDMYVRILDNYLHEKFGPEYELYSAYWTRNDKIPEFDNYNEKRILWLGGYILAERDLDLDSLRRYGLILTAYEQIANYLTSKNENLNVKVLPIFTDVHEIKSVDKQDKFTAIIGYPPFAFEFLDTLGEKYKHYQPEDTGKLLNDLPYFKAVIGYPTSLSSLGGTLHPIVLTAAAHGIPVIGYYMSFNDDALPLLSHYAKYYRSDDELIKVWDDAFQEKDNVQKYALANFSKEKVLQRFDEIVSGQRTYTDIVNIDISTSVADYNSGDYWLALDLADALRRKGYNTDITGGDLLFKPNPKVNIIMRGNLNDVEFDLNGKINILYLAWSNLKVNGIEQSETLEKYIEQIAEAAKKVDYLVVSSPKVVEALHKKGIQAEYIPEFTNVEKFYPDFQENKHTDVLFVGNFHFERKGPLAAAQQNLPIDIYGANWPDWVETKGVYIDNRILRQYYSSAKIVLNDTKVSMREFGFVTTRLYDATASGAFVISDYIPEIYEIYGDSVPMWRTEKELADLIRYYLEHPKEREQKAQRAQKITLENFTADRIANSFDKVIKKITGKNLK
ncbi:MAG: glycosyltransferase [Alphaproteobacteria bacterium]|nr:glycosyltransferase [Alphaproteobacteria bacterium]